MSSGTTATVARGLRGSALSGASAALLRHAVGVSVGTMVYALSLHWVYANLITVPFAYAGFTYREASPQATMATIAVACAVAITLPARPQRVSHVMLWVLFVVGVAPALLMVAYTGYLKADEAVLASATVGVAFGVATVGTRLLDGRGRSAAVAGHESLAGGPLDLGPFAPAPGSDPGRRLPPSTALWVVCGLHSALTYGVMAATTGLSLRFVALDDVYDVRAVYKEEVQGDNGLLGYLLSGQANVVNTVLMARGLSRRNVPLIAVGVIGQLLLYSGTGFKTILFSFPAVVFIALATRVARGRALAPGVGYLAGPVVLMVLAAGADELQGGLLWTSLFARRFLITPGVLTSVYVEFFGENPPAMLGQSVLRWWVDYPYDRSIPMEVGQYLQPGGALAANANLFADGFANFGHLGVLGTGAVLLAFLRFVDWSARGLPLTVGAMVMMMPSITLSNTSLPTAMLSHGLALGTLVLAVAPRTGWEPPSR
ncbi:hypothetical protein [Frigoribacterium sp. MCBA15_019]|uniref:hypothetical protein n=1 Tax=Frigoribacterium sp. MCBA15_019 TaxID=1898745 RepID=UPI0008DD206C|nr:hypothetical protein [Frigoribacterium sp. MCBA15_019]OII21835.1 hypothetical protein BIV04_10430 [Frigoribacterium sp. MCBA15_019]